MSRRDVELRSKYGQRFKVPRLSETVAYQIAINGEHEGITLRALRKLLPPDGTLIDVGANIGFFTVTLAKANPKARIVAVEGSPRVGGFLKHNIEINGASNVTLMQRAITNSDDQTITFYEAPVAQFGRGSIAATLWEEKTEARTLSFDRLIADLGRVDAIKIDIEGSEAWAFEGGREALSKPDAPPIVFEFFDWAESNTPGIVLGGAQRLLREYGYTIWRIEDWLSGGPPAPEIFTTGFQILVAQKKK
jgi:FkbM family methyltransferase